jgi:hypothetical protein
MSFKLIDDVSNVDGSVAIVTHAVGRAGSRGNVIRLAGMDHAEVVSCQTEVGGCCVDERSVQIANQRIEAGILHHDDEDVLKIFQSRATVLPSGERRDYQDNPKSSRTERVGIRDGSVVFIGDSPGSWAFVRPRSIHPTPQTGRAAWLAQEFSHAQL